MAVIKVRVRASSLLEVIISMVVILVVFTIAMGIFANVQKMSLSAQRVNAAALLKEELTGITQSPEILKETTNVGEFSIEKEVVLYSSAHDDLYQVNLAAYDINGLKLAELKELVYDER